jgi:hypothetical protein
MGSFISAPGYSLLIKHSKEVAWPMVIAEVASAPTLLHEAHWAIYWALFYNSQTFAATLGPTRTQEDFLSGQLMENLRERLETWASPHIKTMGYSPSVARISTLRLAGLKSESVTGADIGFCIDIKLGNLKVRKFALLQAKTSINGSANIGSEATGPRTKTQFEKLNNPERDFYLFYNLEPLALLPTVSSIPDLLKNNDLTDVDKTKRHIIVYPEKSGWDWASFFTFGLCSPLPGFGLVLAETESFADVISGLGNFPASIVIASFNGDVMDYSMKQLLKEEYLETNVPKKSLTVAKTPTKDLSADLDFEL